MVLSAGLVRAGSRLLGSNVQVTDDGLNQTEFGEANKPDVAVNGYKVYAVWEDTRNSAYGSTADIYFAKSTDGGASWGNNVQVNYTNWRGIGLSYPSIAVGPEGNIYIAWYLGYCSNCGGTTRENDVHLARSTDGGESFDVIWLWDGYADSVYEIVTPLAVDQSTGKLYALLDDPGASGADIYLVGCVDPDVADWGDSEWWQVQVNDSAQSGRIYDWDDGPLMALAARNGVVCAAWEDSRNSNAIYGACSTDGGQSFGPDFPISGSDAWKPHLAFGPDGTLYAAYQVGNGDEAAIYIRRSTDNGSSWSDPVQVVAGVDNSSLWQAWDMAVDGNGTIAIVWRKMISSITGNTAIHLSTSIDQGQSFSTLSNIQDFDGAHVHLAIAATGSGDYARAYMVWHVDSADNDQIWSARAELDATPPTAPSNLQATPGDTVVDLSWSPSTDRNGISAYYVIRATQSGGPYEIINPFPITGTSYRDVGLGSGTYYYKVYAVDGTGNLGPASNEVGVTVSAGSDLPLNGAIAYEAGSSDIRLNDLPGLGNERTLAQGSAPHFSPDGSQVYYYSGNAILSRPTGGGGAQTHYSDDDLMDYFDIPADTSYFARIEQQFYASLGHSCWAWEPHYGPFGGDDLYVATTALAFGVALSPDRRWLAYTTVGVCGPATTAEYSTMRLCLVNLNTQEKTCYGNANYQDPDFSPSSDWLVFAADFSGQYEIWKAQVQDDGSLTNLTQLTRSGDKWSLMPAWSSDGNWVVFVRGTPAGDDVRLPELQNPQLYVVRADGASLRALNISGEEPDWYGGGPAGGNYQVYLPAVLRQ